MNVMIKYQNNKTGYIDTRLLEDMISVNKIKMFMRSGGWVMVGIDSMRGKGGTYAGMDRRDMYAVMNDKSYQEKRAS